MVEDDNENAPDEQCTCDKTSELHYAITRYIVGFDDEHEFTCVYCHCHSDELDNFISMDAIANQFKQDKVHLTNVRRGPNNLGLFDMIEKMYEMLKYADEWPYVKFREHCAIMFRYQKLEYIVETLQKILNE
jgi:hypothetical protein